MKRVLDLVARVAPKDVTVLFTGESGVGKDVIAAALHAHSRRADKPFVRFNAAAIPAELAEAELFGHTKGAFTGAQPARLDISSSADGGTLFIDEVGELPLAIQAKILRALAVGRGAARRRHAGARRRAPRRRDEPRSRRRREGRALPRRPLVSPQRRPDPRAAASRARRGHRAARPRVRRARTPSDTGWVASRSSPRSSRRLQETPVAGQRPRAREHRRAAARAHRRRPASRSRCGVRSRRRTSRREPRVERPDPGSAHPLRARVEAFERAIIARRVRGRRKAIRARPRAGSACRVPR